MSSNPFGIFLLISGSYWYRVNVFEMVLKIVMPSDKETYKSVPIIFKLVILLFVVEIDPAEN